MLYRGLLPLRGIVKPRSSKWEGSEEWFEKPEKSTQTTDQPRAVTMYLFSSLLHTSEPPKTNLLLVPEAEAQIRNQGRVYTKILAVT